MPIPVQCPKCSARLNAPDAAAGKKVKCRNCQAVLVVPKAAESSDFEVVEDDPPKKPQDAPAVPAKSSAKPARDKDEEEEQEQEEQEEKEEKGARPRKKAPARAADEDDKDDEDKDDKDKDEKPRKKQKQKKKKEQRKSPALLIGVAVLGVLLLAGGAVGIWYATRSPDKPSGGASNNPPNSPNPQPVTPNPPGNNPPGNNPPKNNPPVEQPATVPPADWVVYQPAGAGFKSRIPPGKSSGDIIAGRLAFIEEVGKGKIVGDAYYLTALDGVSFAARILHFAPDTPQATREEILETYVQRIAEPWQKNMPTVKITWMGRDAKERYSKTNNIYDSQRWFTTDTSAYVVNVEATTQKDLDRCRGPFFNSFEMTESAPTTEFGRTWYTVTASDGTFTVKTPIKTSERELNWGPAFVGNAEIPAAGNSPKSLEFCYAGYFRYKAGSTADERAKLRGELLGQFHHFTSETYTGMKLVPVEQTVTVKNRKWTEQVYDVGGKNNLKGTTVVRWCDVGDVFYFAVLARGDGFAPADVQKKFLDSFEILKK